jgi:transposase
VQTGEQPRSGHVVIGVDTHRHVRVTAVTNAIGGILATLTIPTDTGGFQQLADWAGSSGDVLAFGIEGTGSYGARWLHSCAGPVTRWSRPPMSTEWLP